MPLCYLTTTSNLVLSKKVYKPQAKLGEFLDLFRLAVFSVDLVCKEDLNLMLKYLTSSQGAVG